MTAASKSAAKAAGWAWLATTQAQMTVSDLARCAHWWAAAGALLTIACAWACLYEITHAGR